MTLDSEVGFRGVLASRTYRVFVVAFFLDEVCNAVWLVTLGWVVAQSDSDLGAGLILAATALPLLLVLVFASGWVDRHRSPAIALVTLAARAALMLAWVAIAFYGTAPLVLVGVLGAALGAVSGLHEPAMTTYPVILLPGNAQAPAMTIERAGQRLSQAVGGLIAGVLIGHGGIGAPALVGAVLVVAALGILSRLRSSTTTAPSSSSTGGPSSKNSSSILEGLRWVRAHPVLPRTLLVQSSITVTMAAVLLVILPFRARDDGWTAAQYGATIAVFGVGMTVATVAGLLLQRYALRTRLLLSCGMSLGAGLVVILLGVVADPASDAVLMGTLGLALGPAGPFLSGYLRGEAADADSQNGDDSPISGRVMAVLILATDAMEPVGYVLAACLAVFTPLVVPTVLAGVSCVVFGALSLWRVSSVVTVDRSPVSV